MRDDKYLRLPSLIGGSKKSVFNFLKDRVWKRIQGWGNKLLSRDGKTVLVKNVAQSILSYSMTYFLIPKSFCQEIERLMNGFWWSSNENNNKGIRRLAGKKMSMSKGKGGFGFLSLHGFNIALLRKHCCIVEALSLSQSLWLREFSKLVITQVVICCKQ